MGKIFAFPRAMASVTGSSEYEADFCGDGSTGTGTFMASGIPDTQDITSGGEAWRRHQIKVGTALIEMDMCIKNSKFLRETWKKALLGSFCFVRTGIIPKEAFIKIIQLAEEYLRILVVETLPDNITPGQFIGYYMTKFLIERQRAEIAAVQLRMAKADEVFAEEDRPRRESKVQKRRDSIKIVK
ncbi:MAG: hypothetical protein Q8P68_06340 [Candidatus Peregrinibacteria bacterium]|nr:hypothetical protein [Candidatus Peregrinibacteria bacterium]MDZ4244414.1 hypothetical protein [Candidatus Gracilibacteria bacterium]